MKNVYEAGIPVAARYDQMTKLADITPGSGLGRYLSQLFRIAYGNAWKKSNEEIIAEIKKAYPAKELCVADAAADMERSVKPRWSADLQRQENQFETQARRAYADAGMPEELYLGKAAFIPSGDFLGLLSSADGYFRRKQRDLAIQEQMVHQSAALHRQLFALSFVVKASVSALAKAAAAAFDTEQPVPLGNGRFLSLSENGEGFAITGGEQTIYTDFIFTTEEDVRERLLHMQEMQEQDLLDQAM